MQLRFAALLAALLASTAVTPAPVAAADAPASVSELVDALKARYGDVSTLQASFVQTIKNPVMGDSVAKGTVEVARPRKARWETTGEQASLFVTDGKRMSVYTPAMNQVIQMADLSGADTGNVDILSLLEDLSKLDEQFTITMQPVQSGEDIVVDAVPKKPVGYQKVRITLAPSSLDLKAVAFTDGMGNTTQLTFSNLKLDVPLSADRFEFTPPEGTTVIDGSAM